MVWILIEENQHGYVVHAAFHSLDALWVRMNRLEKLMDDLEHVITENGERMVWVRTEKKIKYVAYCQEIE